MIDAETLLRVDNLTLRNFRCFTQCSIELHHKLTVLVAENAQGKTAILDALRLALDVFVSRIAFNQKSRGFSRTDVHLIPAEKGAMQPLLPTEFNLEAYVDGRRVIWSRALRTHSLHGRNTAKDTRAITSSADDLRNKIDTPSLLPIVAFYGTDRLWNASQTRYQRHLPLGRFSAYTDCLSSSSSFDTFAEWYGTTFSNLRSATSKAYGPDERPEKQIAAVHEAVRTVLEPTGWTGIDWQFPDDDQNVRGSGFIVVEHSLRGRFPLLFLSDGVRNMVALAADLAHRCVRLNPHLGESAARLTPGVVLIDEVDMHLHPRWQQLVVELLQKAFPALQMILTTHSPQVLSTVDAESIRLIRLLDGHATTEKPFFQTRGVESADILAKLMDVHPVPQVEQARWLNDYRAMLQMGEQDSPDGRRLWDMLVQHFGEEHPVLSEIDILRRLQEFKQANKISPTTFP